jgi:hypothetical protein
VLSFPPVSRLSSRLWQKKKHPKVNTKLDKIRKFPNPSSQGIPSRRFMRLACLPACIWRACAESYLYVLIVAGQGDPMDDGSYAISLTRSVTRHRISKVVQSLGRDCPIPAFGTTKYDIPPRTNVYVQGRTNPENAVYVKICLFFPLVFVRSFVRSFARSLFSLSKTTMVSCCSPPRSVSVQTRISPLSLLAHSYSTRASRL